MAAVDSILIGCQWYFLALAMMETSQHAYFQQSITQNTRLGVSMANCQNWERCVCVCVCAVCVCASARAVCVYSSENMREKYKQSDALIHRGIERRTDEVRKKNTLKSFRVFKPAILRKLVKKDK